MSPTAISLLGVLSLSATQPAPEEAPPGDTGTGSRGSGRTGADAALDAAYGTPPADVGPDPKTTNDPGYATNLALGKSARAPWMLWDLAYSL